MTKFRKIEIEVVKIENGFLMRESATDDYRHERGEYRYVPTLGDVEQALVPSISAALSIEIPADAPGDF